MKVKELRLVLTVDNLEEIIRFYRDTVGLPVSKSWDEETGSGVILEAGRASLELIDAKHAATIDALEVGRRVAGPVRIALNVGKEIETATATLSAAGAEVISPVVAAPWSRVSRLQDPAGMQLTLFEKSTLLEE
ncbi:VOC family protein [Chitinophaga varians]|uniref:VOC family protein n=1 Tax=Chitinophaga varians TaxID=2202339 RepID=UPI00165EEB35|nr:VOC family protein [Chitinophaga varians]MBC9914185.1 VOC family protein [Chitinophaga varians]